MNSHNVSQAAALTLSSTSVAIATFRRKLMAQRLGCQIPDPTADRLMAIPNATFTRLNDGVEALYAY